MASVRTEWPSLKGDCTPNRPFRVRRYPEILSRTPNRPFRVRDLPNGQNKRPFPGRAHHNHYPRTPNRAIRVRDFPNGPEPSGTSQPRDSGRSKPSRNHQAQAGQEIAVDPNRLEPIRHKAGGAALGLQVRNQSAVSKVPCRISGLMLHGTTQKQGYNAKLATAVSHSSQKASRHSASCAAQPGGLLRLLSASSRIPNPNPQSASQSEHLEPHPNPNPRAEHPNHASPKKQKPSEEGSCKSIKLGRKNYLFCGNHDAAVRAAVVYSLFSSCKAHDVDVRSWLEDTLRRIPTEKNIDQLLPCIPCNWQVLPANGR